MKDQILSNYNQLKGKHYHVSHISIASVRIASLSSSRIARLGTISTCLPHTSSMESFRPYPGDRHQDIDIAVLTSITTGTGTKKGKFIHMISLGRDIQREMKSIGNILRLYC